VANANFTNCLRGNSRIFVLIGSARAFQRESSTAQLYIAELHRAQEA
jgi:hypothetical protein